MAATRYRFKNARGGRAYEWTCKILIFEVVAQKRGTHVSMDEDSPTLKNYCHRPLGNLWQSWQCLYG